MNKKIKNILTGVLALVVFVALVVCAPVSRFIYGIYDNNRTNEILAQLEEAAKAAEQEAPVVSDYQKRAYFKQTYDTVDGKTVEKLDLLVLTSETGYELSYYERVVDGTASYTSEYFHMTGNYTREGNVLTVTPGISALAQSKDGVSYTYYNGQFLTAEEAAGDKTRDEIYDMKYASRSIALMSDGTFVVGGQSDSADVLGAPEGRYVYTSYVAQGRKTYNTLVLVEGGVYFLYNHATNSTNAEQTTGCMFGVGNYEIPDANKGIVPDETEPGKTYDIVNCGVGIGYMYACNNGSHMHFDLQTGAAFSSWLGTSFNTTTPTFYVSETGFNLKLGALKTTVDPWGLYVPAGESAEQSTAAQPAATEAPAAQSLRLEIETSVEGKPFILEFNADGSLLTGWTNYEQTMQNGSWKVADGKLVLDMAYESTIAENAEGGLDITVNYGQMGEKVYTMTAEQAAALHLEQAPAGEDITLEVETSVPGKPFVLTLNADGTLLTGWTNYEQTMVNGTWAVTDGALALEMGSYTAAIAQNAEGGLDITVNYGQMGEKVYTMTAEQAAALHLEQAPAGEDITLEVETSVPGKPFVLTLNADGTLLTGWTNYEQTMVNGTWAVTDGALVLDMAYESTIVENAEGGLDITVNYGQMGEKVYTMTAEQAAALHLEQAPAGEDITLEVETSVPGKPFVLTLNADGTLLTGWTNYEQTMQNGTWKVTDGKLVLDMAYESTIVENAEGGLDITVNYGQMGEKVYTMTAEQAAALHLEAPAGEDITLEVETSVPGKPFVLTLNADGTLLTGWTNYEQTMVNGTWAVTDGALALEMGAYTAAIVQNVEGGLDITVNYGQMGEKVYTMTAEQAALLK